MLTLSLLDNRTLFASNFIIATVFATLFYGGTRVFPYIRGMKSVALSYALAIPACLMLGARGQISDLFSILLANLLVLLSFLAMGNGIARFCHAPRTTRASVWLIAGTMAGLSWFTLEKDSILTRIVLMAIATFILRFVAGYRLLRRSSASPNKGVMRVFGGFLVLVSVISLGRALQLAWVGTTRDFMEVHEGLSLTLLLSLTYMSLSGCCFLLLSSSELITASQQDSEMDLLTGTFNRRGIEERMQQEMRNVRSGGSLVICLLDVDRLKPINDNLGHNAGDMALRSISGALRSAVRPEDHIGRYGGDEFLVLVPTAGEPEITTLLNRLDHAIAALPELEGLVKLGVSWGCAQAELGETTSSLVARADAALYRNKQERLTARQRELSSCIRAELL